jgi:hypothetical protein
MPAFAQLPFSFWPTYFANAPFPYIDLKPSYMFPTNAQKEKAGGFHHRPL